MKLFNGNLEAQKLDTKITQQITDLKSRNEFIGKLLIIQIGENASSEKFISLKKKVGEKLGLEIEILKMTENLDLKTISDKISYNVNRRDVSSVIIQLPLPTQELSQILDLIPLEKDIDVLSKNSQEKFYNGVLQLSSPVVKSAEYFIYSTVSVKNIKKAVIIGGGFLVGKPIEKMLKNYGVKTTIIENYSKGLKLDSDLIVLSAGIPNLVDGNDISAGASVIDFGSSILDGKTVGDLDMNSKIDHINYLSPSPGGMGPLVIRYLFLNHLNK